MANATGAFGLKPVRYLNGAPYDGKVVRAYISALYATACYIGDPVIYSPTLTEKDTTAKLPTINRTAGGTGIVIRGVIVAFEPLRTDLSTQYNPASTERYALITPPDPAIVYHIRGDGSGTPSKVFVGQNATCTDGTASTVTGLSGSLLTKTLQPQPRRIRFISLGWLTSRITNSVITPFGK